MAQSSITGGQRAPKQAEGRSADRLGPSDTSDSGSDAIGVDDRAEALPEGARDGADITPDRFARSEDSPDPDESIADDEELIDELVVDDEDDDNGD